MKMIPKKDLIKLITYLEGDLLSKDTVKRLFENYGDDYFKEGGFYSDWTLTNENEKRKGFMEEVEKFPCIEGALAEMYVDGKWIKGKIVKGYRFDDGIVTIEDDNGHKYWCGQDRTDLYRRYRR